MLTAAQLAMRRKGVTSTDIAAICGLNPYKSALAVYLEKVEEQPPLDQTEAMYWGNAMEGPIGKRYAAIEGVKVLRSRRTYRLRGKDKWMMATPDAFAYADKACWGLENKTAFSARQVGRWGTGGDAVPEEYLVQCAWCMAVCGLPRWDIAVLLAGYHGAEFRVYHLTRDMGLEGRLIELGRAFWTKVQARQEPEPDGSSSAYAALQTLYPDSGGNVRLAMSDEAELVADYSMVDVEFQKADAAREVIRQKLMQTIGQDDGIEGEGFRVTWKPNAKGNRVFRATLNL